MSGRLLGSMFKVVSGHTLADDQDLEDELVDGGYYPKTGSFIDVSHAERVHVLIHLGNLAAVGTFKLYEHDSASGTPTQIDDTNAYYDHTIAATDPALAINWPTKHRLVLSDRDAAAPTLDEVRAADLLPSWDETRTFIRGLSGDESG